MSWVGLTKKSVIGLNKEVNALLKDCKDYNGKTNTKKKYY